MPLGLLKGCLGFVSDRQSTLIGEVFWCLVVALSDLRFVNRELSLTTMVRLYVLQHRVYYSGLSSCYEVLAVHDVIMRFVNRKLSLTTMVRLFVLTLCVISCV